MIRIANLTICPDRRQVLVDDAPVKLGSRAMDVLLVLLDADGAMVAKDELIRRVWPTTFVIENNLQVQISRIRKLLGENRNLLESVPRHGYRLLRPAPPAQDPASPFRPRTPVAGGAGADALVREVHAQRTLAGQLIRLLIRRLRARPSAQLRPRKRAVDVAPDAARRLTRARRPRPGEAGSLR
ncbi:winged helix-turn-helix domain-containing protein [Burkholderia pseudomultivorans]|uniref:Transcriptional activator CadC n=1 Tax=Burkholderia pseudomultivorans TaxID=1207504 RepID=A0ABU2E495_9BURK|nr:winged helix-turn-helix domain-containing protein [Burkholderia pseudomultivorans]MDR8732299.1 Transcriptional activator CadC [Burkholderia pseudomultivorans]MDR8736951.1 Transcriptional activator CadC [Burkholderia pseudomultivorans]MDR8743154.1 Transcriptional activator CadC [Burkholderia pseudomultivorans]MDR8754529.1 Transcriptional activator CadC [Burkholderia pseudomultivorans]MDR8779882.1 Transcriptional activator CadC [Burkholderia pseudomultivorans]